MKAVADKLRKARALIAKGWTRDAWARGKSGREVDVKSRYATCWCAYGAIEAVVDDPWDAPDVAQALSAAVGTLVTAFNDGEGRTQTEVLAAFDKAIELAEAGQ